MIQALQIFIIYSTDLSKFEHLIFFYFDHSSIGVYLATVNMYAWSILFFFFVLSQHFCSHACIELTLLGMIQFCGE